MTDSRRCFKCGADVVLKTEYGEPIWKTVDCPRCDSKVGQSCGQTVRGASWWQRTAPHVGRKRLARICQGCVELELFCTCEKA